MHVSSLLGLRSGDIRVAQCNQPYQCQDEKHLRDRLFGMHSFETALRLSHSEKMVGGCGDWNWTGNKVGSKPPPSQVRSMVNWTENMFSFLFFEGSPGVKGKPKKNKFFFWGGPSFKNDEPPIWSMGNSARMRPRA